MITEPGADTLSVPTFISLIKMKANILYVEQTGEIKNGRPVFAVVIDGVTPEDRKVILNKIKDSESFDSDIQFEGWSRDWKCFYNSETKEWSIKPVFIIEVSTPEVFTYTDAGIYVLDLIS